MAVLFMTFAADWGIVPLSSKFSDVTRIDPLIFLETVAKFTV